MILNFIHPLMHEFFPPAWSKTNPLMRVSDLLSAAHRAFMGLELSHLRGDRNPQMNESLSGQIDALRALTFQQLRHKHVELFGEPCGSRHRQQVVRRIGWRLQVLAEGGLSERAHRRALEIADDADLRTLPPIHPMEDPRAPESVSLLSAKDRRVPQCGAVLI